MSYYSTVRVGLFTLFTASCGGGDDGTGDATQSLNNTTPNPITFAQMVERADAMEMAWDGVTATAPTTLPTGGQADYSGTLLMATTVAGDEMQFAGNLNMAVSFGTDSISGGASGFRDETNTAVAGVLTMSDGALHRLVDPAVGQTFTATLTGDLSEGANSYQILSVLGGNFLGADQLAVTGAIVGTVDLNGVNGLVYGGFVAEQ